MKDNTHRKLSPMEKLGHYVATPSYPMKKSCRRCGKFQILASKNRPQGVCEATRQLTWVGLGGNCQMWIPASERQQWRRQAIRRELEMIENREACHNGRKPEEKQSGEREE